MTDLGKAKYRRNSAVDRLAAIEEVDEEDIEGVVCDVVRTDVSEVPMHIDDPTMLVYPKVPLLDVHNGMDATAVKEGKNEPTDPIKSVGSEANGDGSQEEDFSLRADPRANTSKVSNLLLSLVTFVLTLNIFATFWVIKESRNFSSPYMSGRTRRFCSRGSCMLQCDPVTRGEKFIPPKLENLTPIQSSERGFDEGSVFVTDLPEDPEVRSMAFQHVPEEGRARSFVIFSDTLDNLGSGLLSQGWICVGFGGSHKD